jgi:hypothetical protein
MSTRFGLIAVVLALAAGPGPVHALDADDAATLADFNRRVVVYAELHYMLEATVPRIGVSPDPAEIGRAVEALGAAVRKARVGAREGDVFFPAAAQIFRRIIREQYRNRFLELRIMTHDDVPPLDPPVVNGHWPGEAFTFMPPDLLARFPALPGELQYRFVNRDLVLWDAHANVIVDVIRRAIPEETTTLIADLD